MKSKKSVSTIFIGLGVVLALKGIAFYFMKWPDGFLGLYAGLVFMILGLVIVSFPSSNVKSSIAKKTQLSSGITFIYKLIIPFFGFLFLVIYFIFVLHNNKMLDFWVPLGLFVLVLWLILLIIGLKIYQVFFDSSGILFIRYGTKKKFTLHEVLSVERFFFNFYRIKLIGGKFYYFIPHISELLENPMSDPSSITQFRDILSSIKTPH